MTRVQNGSRTVARLTRRRVLAIAATVGVGASTAGVAGLSLAGEKEKEDTGGTEPLVLSLRDAKKGTFDVFSGGSRVTLTDPKLAARLRKAARRG
jgi:hypothetical protein